MARLKQKDIGNLKCLEITGLVESLDNFPEIRINPLNIVRDWLVELPYRLSIENYFGPGLHPEYNDHFVVSGRTTIHKLRARWVYEKGRSEKVGYEKTTGGKLEIKEKPVKSWINLRVVGREEELEPVVADLEKRLSEDEYGNPANAKVQDLKVSPGLAYGYTSWIRDRHIDAFWNY